MKEPVIYWIRELKKRGIQRFEFNNLPQDLKDKSVLKRAKNRGFIKSISKDQNRVNTWTISQYRPKGRAGY